MANFPDSISDILYHTDCIVVLVQSIKVQSRTIHVELKKSGNQGQRMILCSTQSFLRQLILLILRYPTLCYGKKYVVLLMD